MKISLTEMLICFSALSLKAATVRSFQLRTANSIKRGASSTSLKAKGKAQCTLEPRGERLEADL